MVISLTLTNIRCWEGTHKFKFNTNFVLLSGPSGKGKTSILESILYALYGKVTKICTEGKTKCKVVFNIKTDSLKLKIERSKGPNKLVVDGKYEGTEGQKVIEGIFGTQTKFLLSSYIRQKSRNSFLSMSPTDKLEFIESIAMSDNRSSNLKSDIKTSIKKLQSQLSCKQAEIKSVDEIINETECTELWSGEIVTDEEMNEYRSELDMNRTEEKTSSSSIKKYNKSLVETMEIETMIDGYKKQLYECREEMKEISYKDVDTSKNESDIDLISKIESVRECVEAKNKLRETEETMASQVESIQEDITKSIKDQTSVVIKYTKLEETEMNEKTLNELYTHVKEVIEIEALHSRSLKPRYSSIELEKMKEELDVTRSAISVLSRNIEIISNELECPSCSCKLTLKNNQLIETETRLENDIETMNNLLEKQKQKMTTLSRQIKEGEEDVKNYTKYKEIVDKIEVIHVGYGNRSFTELKMEVKNRIKKKKEAIRNISIAKDKIEVHEKTLQLILDKKYNKIPSLSSIYTKVKALRKAIASVNCQVDDDVISQYTELKRRVEIHDKNTSHNNYSMEVERKLHKKIKELNRCVKDVSEKTSSSVECIQKKINKYTKILENAKENIIIIHDKIENGRNYIEWKKIYNRYTTLLDKKQKISDEEKLLVKDLLNNNTLKSIVLKAESLSISTIVNTINVNVKEYLDNFFSEEPISVKINTFKEVNKNKKPQINVDIGYKSMTCDPSTLSGGEYDRVQMAFTLAIADLVQSPIILLDESISSLDEKTSSSILKSITNNIHNKSIINVAHQVCKGSFTEIVKL